MPLRGFDYGRLLDEMFEGLQVIDRSYRYLYVNAAVARQARCRPQDLIGRTMPECFPGVEGSPAFQAITRCLSTGSAQAVVESAFDFPDGSSGVFELRIEPSPLGAVVLSIDVTERKRTEERLAAIEVELARAQRLDAVGLLAASVAHDFNNMLAVVLVQGERALMRPGGPLASDIEAMMAAARASEGLTRQLMTIGRSVVLRRSPVDVREVLGGLEPVLRAAMPDSITLVIETDEAPLIDADRTHIEQVVTNLVYNARDAIDGAGHVTVRASSEVLDESALEAHPGQRPGRYLRLSVVDDGVGMDVATRARVFEPFFTTKKHGRGTGLGLATLYGIVRQHGGHIVLESSVGRGTSFDVYFPALSVSGQPVASPDRPGTSGSPGRNGSPSTESTVARELASVTSTLRRGRQPGPEDPRPAVLLADESESVRRAFGTVLTEAGFRVLLAGSGLEARDVWEREAPRIELLITEGAMPDLPGAELIAHVRRRAPTLPVICTSSVQPLESRRELLDRVMFVEKPFSSRKLIAKVREILAS